MNEKNILLSNIIQYDKANMAALFKAQYILNGKWKLLILLSLYGDPKRFKEIHTMVEGITAKVLSTELKDMESKQLLKRTIYNTYPIVIEYSVTPFALTLNSVLVELRNWSIQND